MSMKHFWWSFLGISFVCVQAVARTPQTDVEVRRPQTSVSAVYPVSDVQTLRPATSVQMNYPATQSGAIYPATSVEMQRPQTTVSAQYPATTVGASYPQTTVEVLHPQTTVEVLHPQTLADIDLNPWPSGTQDPSAKAGGRVGGSSAQAQTSMSDYTPKQAKNFSAPDKAAPTGGGTPNLGNTTNEAEKDAANKNSLMGSQDNQNIQIDPSKNKLPGFEKMLENRLNKGKK